MIRYLLPVIFLVLSISVLDIFAINSEGLSVLENSPYPEFIYIDNEILPEISEMFIEMNIPSFLFYFIDGVYIDGESSEEVAIKTPLWLVVKLIKMLNLFSEELENIYPENGFLFINSKYRGTPERDYRVKYILQDYGDLIVYLNDSVLCAKFEDNNTAYFNIAVQKDKVFYEQSEDEKTVVQLINGLKSISGIKVRESRSKIDGDILVINVVLDADVSDIKKLMTDLNLSYVPITVNVKGDWIREDENRYTKNLDYMIVYTTPLDRNTTLTVINSRDELDTDLKEKIGEYNYQGWYVEEYQHTYNGYTTKLYICTKDLEYGTVCIITNRLENLRDIEIYEGN